MTFCPITDLFAAEAGAWPTLPLSYEDVLELRC